MLSKAVGYALRPFGDSSKLAVLLKNRSNLLTVVFLTEPLYYIITMVMFSLKMGKNV